MTTVTPSGPSTWSVTAQQDQTQPVPGQGPVRGKLIYFTTGLGNMGSVFVPNSIYGANAATKAVIAAAVENLDGVGQLTDSSAV